MKCFWQNDGCHSRYFTVYSLSCSLLCSGKWKVLHPFPQGGVLVPHRANLRSLSLVPCTWVTRDNWNAVKVLFEENSAVKGPDLELATLWDIARHPHHHTYNACTKCTNHLKSIFFAINQKIDFFCVTYGFSIYLIRFLLTLACIPSPSARTMTSKVPICFVGAVSTIYARAWITWLYLWQGKRN